MIPGPVFQLLRRTGVEPFASGAAGRGDLVVPHATTCVAVRFADGVVMAGDRRATSGNLISHRTMEKVMRTVSALTVRSDWPLSLIR